MIAPPTAGPKLRAMLKPMLLYATTAGSSERGTMSLTDACQAGELSAVPQPIAKVKSSKIEGVSPPSHATSASNSDVASMNSWATINMILRSRLSATAPDHSDRRTSGRVVDDCTSAIRTGDAVKIVIIHAAATSWMRAPKFETRLAIQTARKIGIAIGEDVRSGSAKSFASIDGGAVPPGAPSRDPRNQNRTARRKSISANRKAIGGARPACELLSLGRAAPSLRSFGSNPVRYRRGPQPARCRRSGRSAHPRR